MEYLIGWNKPVKYPLVSEAGYRLLAGVPRPSGRG
jgi:hypothetical protein